MKMKQKFSTIVRYTIWFIALMLNKNWKLTYSKHYGIRWTNTEYGVSDAGFDVKLTQNLTTKNAYAAEKNRRHNNTTKPDPSVDQDI